MTSLHRTRCLCLVGLLIGIILAADTSLAQKKRRSRSGNRRATKNFSPRSNSRAPSRNSTKSFSRSPRNNSRKAQRLQNRANRKALKNSSRGRRNNSRKNAQLPNNLSNRRSLSRGSQSTPPNLSQPSTARQPRTDNLGKRSKKTKVRRIPKNFDAGKGNEKFQQLSAEDLPNNSNTRSKNKREAKPNDALGKQGRRKKDRKGKRDRTIEKKNKKERKENSRSRPNKNKQQLNKQGDTKNAIGSVEKQRDAKRKAKELRGSKRNKNKKINGKKANPQLVSLDKKLDDGKLNQVLKTKNARKTELAKQLKMQRKGGDVARKLRLREKVARNGGWRRYRRRNLGVSFTAGAFMFNSGWWPGYYPGSCYYPHWCNWVNWCWNWSWPVNGINCWDPRPVYCRPIFGNPCRTWVAWNHYPVWTPLPHDVCGTWVDVEPVVIETGLDLQLLAVRFVDAGHPEQNFGARYRVYLRNNSDQSMNQPFNVLLVASNDTSPSVDALNAGFQLETIDAGETKAIDIRLPMTEESFSKLHVLVDSHEDIKETEETNNGAILNVVDILPVDPVLFGSEDQQIVTGSVMTLAGEGLGPAPGRVLVHASGLEWEAEIEGWTDLGVQIKLPALPVTDDTPAEIVLFRGDDAATNPLSVTITPAP